MQYIVIPLLFVAMYMVVIRPQQRRLRDQQALVSSLVVGDEVISSSGIYGTITGLDPSVAVLQVADGVEIRIARPAIARRIEPVEPDPARSPEDPEVIEAERWGEDGDGGDPR